MAFRLALIASLIACGAAFAPPATRIATTSACTRTSMTTMQFNNALGGLNDELRNEMAGLDDDEVPMTKAEMKKLEKEAKEEMQKLKEEAAAAEAAKKAAE
uniref:Uncharacterized protein n=1 Tax=Prymnesium polylepis TaxID=72548 RepID=A0A7S4M300_9EUKA|mmetsp:Transcript_14687/g.37299  ORF Transcript_14687/g.37299 Transcript_14687/m.37299 type:complete len:101 (+) Transcript_14687:17-319(+)